MCVLCGTFIDTRHWSDGATDALKSRQERHKRQRLIAAVLTHYGLKLRPLTGGGYLVSTASGASELASDLTGLWTIVERATGGQCDPLDPGLITALAKGSETVR
jgi:hypothetical protein